MTPLSQHEALVGVALCAAFADGSMGEEEDEELAASIQGCRALEGLDEDAVRAAMVKANGILRSHGEDGLLARAAAGIREDMRATAFYLGADIVLADGELAGEERAFVERLRKHLGVPEATAGKVVEVIRIRNKA